MLLEWVDCSPSRDHAAYIWARNAVLAMRERLGEPSKPWHALSMPLPTRRPDFAACQELAAAVVNASVPCPAPPCALGALQVGPSAHIPFCLLCDVLLSPPARC